MSLSSNNTSNDDYETRHTTWRETRKNLDAAQAQQRHSVFPEVNAARQAEQTQVREQINAARHAEETARAALNFPWEN